MMFSVQCQDLNALCADYFFLHLLLFSVFSFFVFLLLVLFLIFVVVFVFCFCCFFIIILLTSTQSAISRRFSRLALNGASMFDHLYLNVCLICKLYFF